jgi:hypothetical protein
MTRYFCTKYQRDLTDKEVKYHACKYRPNKAYRGKSVSQMGGAKHKCRNLYIID